MIRLASHHPTWAVGCTDEGWWSRLAQPDQHGWGADDQLRLEALERATDDRDPKALACYGVLVRRSPLHTDQLLLRCVAGRPVSAVTTDCLAWCSERLAAQGRTGLVLIWDNASWHTSQHVRRWIRAHNRAVKRTGQGVRFIPCLLPGTPWVDTAGERPVRALASDRPYPTSRASSYSAENGRDGLTDRRRTHGTRSTHQK